MGFSYGTNPLTGYSALCCDFCGNCKGETGENGERITLVTKKKCPYGYCQSWATCNQCAKLGKHKAESSTGFDTDPEKDKELRKNHAGCKPAHEEYTQARAVEKQALDSGKWIRTSALGYGDQVKVIFRNKDGQEKAYFMHCWTYGVIPLLQLATPEDYAKIDKIELAQNTDIYDGEQYAEVKPVQ